MSSNLYADAQASLFAFCRELIAELNPSVSSTLELVKFDAYADPKELPEKDLIGPFQFQVDVDGSLLTVSWMLLLSTIQDTNLFRLDDMVSHAFQRVQPDKTVPFVAADGSGNKGLLKVMEGVQVMPVDLTANRPMKAIALQMGTDRAFA